MSLHFWRLVEDGLPSLHEMTRRQIVNEYNRTGIDGLLKERARHHRWLAGQIGRKLKNLRTPFNRNGRPLAPATIKAYRRDIENMRPHVRENRQIIQFLVGFKTSNVIDFQAKAREIRGRADRRHVPAVEALGPARVYYL